MIEVKKVSKTYQLGKSSFLKAVDEVSFSIEQGETLAIVGESGSGKSTLAKMILGLVEPSSGEIFFEGKRKTTLLPKKIQMVFQDPYSSLNPKLKVGTILSEPSVIHGEKPRVEELLDLISLPKESKDRYPHEFSGGQRQRIAIARALALNPDFLICDEPLSALDVSIQAQIINLLQKLQKELSLTILFISHDLAVVKYLSDRILVMHRGKLIEMQKTESLFQDPKKSYTKKLLSSALSFANICSEKSLQNPSLKNDFKLFPIPSMKPLNMKKTSIDLKKMFQTNKKPFREKVLLSQR